VHHLHSHTDGVCVPGGHSGIRYLPPEEFEAIVRNEQRKQSVGQLTGCRPKKLKSLKVCAIFYSFFHQLNKKDVNKVQIA
jgi:hypothetical protein